jgi:uncharacterized membrane protein YphA (DoxX/SURF4 family)
MKHYIKLANRILLGLLMLIPGIMALFITKPQGVSNMLGGLGFSFPVFWAWLLILSELAFGILVIFGWRLQWSVIPPIFILLVAAVTAHKNDLIRILIHLIIASNYALLGWASCCKKEVTSKARAAKSKA